MKFNLRQARKLENKIGAFIGEKQRDIETATAVRVNEDLANIDTIVNDARSEFFAEFTNLNNLVETRQEIRNLIGNANHTESINKLISDKVLAEAKLNKINHFLGFGTFDKKQTEDSLEHKKILLEKGERYGRTSTSVSFLTKIDEDKFKSDKHTLVNKIEALDNTLAKSNYTIEVTLSSNMVKLLKDNLLL